ncbi:hypothetical protein PINS_up017216 [Pythium insidiosum]|nr:hypothetical protein PINS_up017216 [Pythium insidiosum]
MERSDKRGNQREPGRHAALDSRLNGLIDHVVQDALPSDSDSDSDADAEEIAQLTTQIEALELQLNQLRLRLKLKQDAIKLRRSSKASKHHASRADTLRMSDDEQGRAAEKDVSPLICVRQ